MQSFNKTEETLYAQGVAVPLSTLLSDIGRNFLCSVLVKCDEANRESQATLDRYSAQHHNISKMYTRWSKMRFELGIDPTSDSLENSDLILDNIGNHPEAQHELMHQVATFFPGIDASVITKVNDDEESRVLFFVKSTFSLRKTDETRVPSAEEEANLYNLLAHFGLKKKNNGYTQWVISD